MSGHRVVKVFQPQNRPILEVKLDEEEMAYLWKSIDRFKEHLDDDQGFAARFKDQDDWFFNRVAGPLVGKYEELEATRSSFLQTTSGHKVVLDAFWVNYTKQGEFNPPHRHRGLYSFVIWMKIPTKWNEQNDPAARTNSAAMAIGSYDSVSAFQFLYTDIVGQVCQSTYHLGPEHEGTMVLFPAALTHEVLPFHGSDETRISISGNLALDSFQPVT